MMATLFFKVSMEDSSEFFFKELRPKRIIVSGRKPGMVGQSVFMLTRTADATDISA